MNKEETLQFVESMWDSWYVPGLSDFVRCPNLTQMVDENFLTNGLIQQAMKLVDDYVNKLEIKGMEKKIFEQDGYPLICYVVEPSSPDIKANVLCYGHLDKQPYGDGWLTNPTEPVIKGDLMYGRGAHDDGYAVFTCMLAIKAGQLQNAPMPRVCMVLETEEESGSEHLVQLLHKAKDATGTPDYLFCMDSGCIDYEQLWMTSSLRGVAMMDVEVQLGAQGYHSGECGGIIMDTFHIMRVLMDRLDDSKTGLACEELQVECPEWKAKEAEHLTQLKGMGLCTKYPVAGNTEYAIHEGGLKEMYLDNVWRANLSITGAAGIPPTSQAGNVIRSSTAFRLSMRLPPVFDPAQAIEIMKKKVTEDVPYNAKVTVLNSHGGSGWCMKELKPSMQKSMEQAGSEFFDGKPAGSYGEGGSIPFLKQLEEIYP